MVKWTMWCGIGNFSLFINNLMKAIRRKLYYASKKIPYIFQCSSIFLVCISYATLFMGFIYVASGMDILLNY